jgi:hypothetical protein
MTYLSPGSLSGRVSQMSSSDASARTADHKSVVAPSTRLTALYSALPDVPKPVVQLMDEYLHRPPPSELIRELSSAISSKLTVGNSVKTTGGGH